MNYFDKVKKESRDDFEIVEYSELLDESIEELKSTNPNNVLKYGFDELDRTLGYIEPGQLILIGGVTGTGKTTFSNSVIKNIAKEGHIVGRFILEDRQEDLKKEEIYYEIVKIRKQRGETKHYPLHEFRVNNIKSPTLDIEMKQAIKNLKENNKNVFDIVKKDDKVLDIAKLEELVKQLINKGCKIILLDHLQEFKVEGEELRHDLRLEDMMYKIKAIARTYKISIILVAHYAKLGGKKPDDESFKNSGAITQVANKVIHLYRDKTLNDGMTEIIISKNRGMGWTGTLQGYFDKESFGFTSIFRDN